VPEKPPDFASVLAALNEAQVRFVLIGGLAMVSHGSAHITQDIDIFYDREPRNRSILVQALKGHAHDCAALWRGCRSFGTSAL
jgi:predicted nucleotidyltransferase